MLFRAHAGTFLFCCLALLLATGLYQRVANPSLEYHLEHAATPTERGMPPSAAAPGEDTPTPLTPEFAEKLARAMKDLREQPGNPEIHMYIADIFVRHNDWHSAAKFMERAVAAAPENAKAWYAYGMVLSGHKEYEKAAQAFEKVLTLDAANTDAMANLITLYRRDLNQPMKAVGLAEKILAAPDAGETAKKIAGEALQKPR